MKAFVTIPLCALLLGGCSLTTVCSISFESTPADKQLLPLAASPLGGPSCHTVTDEDGKPARLCQDGDYIEIKPLSQA